MQPAAQSLEGPEKETRMILRMLLLAALGQAISAPAAPPKAAADATPNRAAASAAEAAQTPPGTLDRERRFTERMRGVVLEGYWRMTQPGDADPQAPRLSDPRPERYAIVGAQKLSGDQWLITARIQYATRDVNLPVPVRVVWAGDTPVITVNELALPLLGTYSARVMIYHDAYAGIWHGGGHGGVMSGTILPAGRPNAGAPDNPPQPPKEAD
jgi:hypothetical protein